MLWCKIYGYFLVILFWGEIVVEVGVDLVILYVEFDCDKVFEVWCCVFLLIYEIEFDGLIVE